MQDAERQRQYYARTAAEYDLQHGTEKEHVLAMHLLAAYIEHDGIRSVLDVGAGTGRAMSWLRDRVPALDVRGIEPVAELREQAYAKGLSREKLVAGDAYNLPFADDSVDLVCEFAVLHHVNRPEDAIAEMSRVASRALAISDCNFMGQGSPFTRLVKTALFAGGLWPLANWVKTRGKGYTISEGDGLAYSYSVFQSLSTLRRHWRTMRITNTDTGTDGVLGPIVSAGHVLLVASDKR
jgi:ubiquinone/menaquinone biosynthesis C-methylase UbiE